MYFYRYFNYLSIWDWDCIVQACDKIDIDLSAATKVSFDPFVLIVTIHIIALRVGLSKRIIQ